MNRKQKEAFVQSLSERLSNAPFVMLADYRGLTVAESNALRRKLDEAGVDYRVVKNTLARLAVKGTAMEGMCEDLAGMTGWVISGEDPVAAAKAIRDVTKDLNFKKLDKFIVKGGFFEGESQSADAIVKVADLPSREELLVKLLQTLLAGPRQVMGVIQAPARDLLYLLKNYETKLSEQEPVA